MSQPQYLRISEVADLLRVSPETVRRWISRGQLAAHKPRGGRSYLVRREDAQRTLVVVQACREGEEKVRLPRVGAGLCEQARDVLERNGLLRYAQPS